jgi:hypothetical protein
MRRLTGLGAVLAAGTMWFAGQALAASTSNGRGQNELSVFSPGFVWTCAIDSNQEAVCAHSFGQIPEPVGVSNAVNLSTSQLKACAVTRNGEVWCWDGRGAPVKHASFGPGAGLTAISIVMHPVMTSPDYSQCVLASNGRVYCWGDNSDGQLGDGSSIDRPLPVQVLNVSGVVQLSTGSTHSGPLTCAVRYTGGVRCWGHGMATPIAITGADHIREVVIGFDNVCLWRVHQGSSHIYCAPPTASKVSKFSNFTRMEGLVYPVSFAGSARGNLCVGDVVETALSKCHHTAYGLDKSPKSGFMTTLNGYAPLVFGDFSHSCAEFPDRSLRCMVHGMLVPPCDLATKGAACINSLGTPQPPGTWELTPNLILAESNPPTIGNATDPKLDAKTSTSLTVSWRAHSTSTGHKVRVCDRYASCSNVTAAVVEVGGRQRVTAAGLRPNTEYTVSMQGYNWGSSQGSVAVATTTSP